LINDFKKRTCYIRIKYNNKFFKLANEVLIKKKNKRMWLLPKIKTYVNIPISPLTLAVTSFFYLLSLSKRGDLRSILAWNHPSKLFFFLVIINKCDFHIFLYFNFPSSYGKFKYYKVNACFEQLNMLIK
jgi:hypothetical protein